MRASLLASAIASMLRWSLLDSCSIQGHKPRIAAFGRRASTTCAACTNSVRRYLLPRLEILPRIVISGRILLRYEPQPGAEVASLREAGAIADRRHHGTRDDRANPRHRHHPLATFILFRKRFDLSRHRRNALVQSTPVLDQLGDEIDHPWRQCIVI